VPDPPSSDSAAKAAYGGASSTVPPAPTRTARDPRSARDSSATSLAPAADGSGTGRPVSTRHTDTSRPRRNPPSAASVTWRMTDSPSTPVGLKLWYPARFPSLGVAAVLADVGLVRTGDVEGGRSLGAGVNRTHDDIGPPAVRRLG
jgi:hypothetical protein